jgi:NO-binding membrane sensor protein with MHYT domain
MRGNGGLWVGLGIVLFTGFVVLDLAGLIDWQLVVSPGSQFAGEFSLFVSLGLFFVLIGGIFAVIRKVLR